MKLKFKATAKDYLIFAIFAVVLLYFVAIAVLNLGSFASNATFHGLNPIPAFSKEYIAPTIVGYIASLAFIIASVSSYFFERDKGFGFSTGVKEEKGYSRWCEEKEFKKHFRQIIAGVLFALNSIFDAEHCTNKNQEGLRWKRKRVYYLRLWRYQC